LKLKSDALNYVSVMESVLIVKYPECRLCIYEKWVAMRFPPSKSAWAWA